MHDKLRIIFKSAFGQQVCLMQAVPPRHNYRTYLHNHGNNVLKTLIEILLESTTIKIPFSLQSILTEHVSHNRYSNLTTQAKYSLHLVAESWCSPLGCVRKQISPVSPSGSDRTRGFAFQTTKKSTNELSCK
jgi:hypothetical protein